MQIFKASLLTALTALSANHALAGDLVIENKSSHKIAAKVVSNPSNPEDQAYALSIDGSKVTVVEVLMMEAMLPMLADDGEPAERQEILALIQEPPLFMKEEGQKAVFTDSAECGPNGVKFEITAKSGTEKGCISLEKDPSDKPVWLFLVHE